MPLAAGHYKGRVGEWTYDTQAQRRVVQANLGQTPRPMIDRAFRETTVGGYESRASGHRSCGLGRVGGLGNIVSDLLVKGSASVDGAGIIDWVDDVASGDVNWGSVDWKSAGKAAGAWTVDAGLGWAIDTWGPSAPDVRLPVGVTDTSTGLYRPGMEQPTPPPAHQVNVTVRRTPQLQPLPAVYRRDVPQATKQEIPWGWLIAAGAVVAVAVLR